MDHRRLERLLDKLHATDPSASVLHRLCVVCEGAAAVDGAGVSVMSNARPDPLAASSHEAAVGEALQEELAEGPCVEAIATARVVMERDLRSPRARERWPRFAAAATDRGILAAFAFPVLDGKAPVGALDLYSRAPRPLEADQVDDARLLAELAGLALRPTAGPSIPGVDLSAETAEPWAHPAVVHQASGVVAEQLGVTVDDAFLRLRTLAFLTERALAEVAADVVAHRLHLESWSGRD